MQETCSTEFTFAMDLNSFQPVPNATKSDWKTSTVIKIFLPRFLSLKSCLLDATRTRLIQGTMWSELVDLVQLQNTLTGNTFRENEMLPTREENIGNYAVPRCIFGWIGFWAEDYATRLQSETPQQLVHPRVVRDSGTSEFPLSWYLKSLQAH